jgi:hypothetical protein
MFIAKAHLQLIEAQLAAAQAETLALKVELVQERERNRKREEDLVDRVLTRHGSRPITPAPEPQSVQAHQVYSSLQAARLDDRRQEFLEHHGLENQNLTPHIQAELDQFLDDESKRDISYVNQWQR